MADPKKLTRPDILRAAQTLSWNRKMPKWTVLVEGRELPARPLVLEAAGVAPNDPTNSHQAVAILEDLGFETRYGDKADRMPTKTPSEPPRGTNISWLLSMVEEISNDIPEEEWKKIPSDLAINLDHYLYGHPKKDKK